jgi:hypothetical protein
MAIFGMYFMTYEVGRRIDSDNRRIDDVNQGLTHLLHHDYGSYPFSVGCNFENGLVTRFLST